MALIRIKFGDIVDDPSCYELPINPDEVELLDSVDYDLVDTLDGSPIRSVATFDSRPRILKWPYYESTNTTFSGMESELKSYKGLNKKLNLQDLDVYSWGWRSIKVIDVTTSIMRGGKIRKNMELIYVYTSSRSEEHTSELQSL